MLDDDYIPNKYTRHIPLKDWQAFQRGEIDKVRVLNPEYINEPYEKPVMKTEILKNAI